MELLRRVSAFLGPVAIVAALACGLSCGASGNGPGSTSMQPGSRCLARGAACSVSGDCCTQWCANGACAHQHLAAIG